MSVRLALLALALLVAVPAVAPAQTAAVNAARLSGLVGERFDGYLGMSSTAPATLANQVAAINIRRRSLYSRLAAARGVSPGEVGISAGCQLMRRVAVGQVYMLADRTWRRRGPGQAAPVPDYCG